MSPGAPRSSGPASAGLEKTTLNVGIIPIVDLLQMYVAQANGYFADEGLTVKTTAMAGGAAIAPAVQSGQLDIGWSNVVSMIVAHDKGFDFKLIGGGAYQGQDHWNIGLLAPPNSKINGPADLKGARVAVNTLGAVNELAVRAYAAKAGVDTSTIQFVEVGFPDMPPALTAGRVDAALVEEPFLSIAGNNGTAKVVDPAVYREIATDPIIVAGWFTTSSWMAQNPRTLAAFGRAIHRATDTINQDPDTARAAISKFTPTSAEQAKTVKLKAFSNDITPAQLQPWVDLSAKFGYIAKPFSPEVLVAG